MAETKELTDLKADVVNLSNLVETLTLRMSTQPGAQCSAELPHPGGLTYLRGPDYYACHCGMFYKKNGKGGLEVMA